MVKTATGVYLHYVDGYLQELGFDSERIFHNAGLAYPNYIKPGEQVSLSVIANLIEHVEQQVKVEDFVIQLGKRIPLMAHGNLGVAMLACKDIYTLLTLSERFSKLVFSSIHLSVRNQENGVAFGIRSETGFPVLDVAVMEAMLGTVMGNLQRLSGVDIHPKHVSISYKKPNHYHCYEALLQCPIEFEAAENVLLFSKKHMALPIQTADNLGGAFLVEQCKEDLDKIEQGSPFIVRVSEIVIHHLDSSPSITFVAERMQLSERTLRRRLAEEGLSFRDLIKNIRHERAEYFLQRTDFRIEKIAWELGYKETANFRRAFKEQTGLSPRDWRKIKTK